jgi:hypothetical protein
MNSIKGVYKNGQIIPNEPADWPDGTEVRIEPITAPAGAPRPDQGDIGMTEEEQGDDPESIARWLAEFDAIPPLQMTPEEAAEWRAARKAQRELEIATFNERAEKLRGMWE